MVNAKSNFFQGFNNVYWMIIDYSKVPIIRTGTYASSAEHTMYCQNSPMFGTYNRSLRVLYLDIYDS